MLPPKAFMDTKLQKCIISEVIICQNHKYINMMDAYIYYLSFTQTPIECSATCKINDNMNLHELSMQRSQ